MLGISIIMSSTTTSFEKFDPSKWVVVGDMVDCEFTQKQVKYLQDNKVPLHGAILCNDEKSKKSSVCTELEYFPAFCNVDSNLCVSGYRSTSKEFDELQMKNDEKKRTD